MIQSALTAWNWIHSPHHYEQKGGSPFASSHQPLYHPLPPLTPTNAAPSLNNLTAMMNNLTSTAPPVQLLDLMAMDIDCAACHPSPTCFKCQRKGHVTRNCRSAIQVCLMEVNKMSEGQKQHMVNKLKKQGFF